MQRRNQRVYLSPREAELLGLETPLEPGEFLGAAAIAMDASDSRWDALSSLPDTEYWADRYPRNNLDHEACVLASLARRLATAGASDFGRLVEVRLLGVEAA